MAGTRKARPLVPAVAAAALLAGCVATSEPSAPTASAGRTSTTPHQAHPDVSPAAVSTRAAAATKVAATKVATPSPAAVAAVDRLRVVAKVYSPKYSRASQFGAWADTDGNHCDTRNDILRRDLKAVSVRSGNCLVQTGILVDPYTGKTVKFTRGPDTSDAVEIDHIVSVADAWRSGAYAWTPGKRIAFYNDPLNLQATTKAQNDAKGDRTADKWLPAHNRCTFARQQITVKAKYRLTISAAEKEALRNACGTSKPIATSPAAAPRKVAASTSAVRTITPGAFCKHADIGVKAVGKNGVLYMCEKNGNQVRWVRQ